MEGIHLEHLKLDKFNLEKEACQQASIYQYYAQMVADKQKELDHKNLQYENAEADFKIEIKCQNPKLTIDQVASCVAKDSSLYEKRSQIIEIKHELATLKTMVTALEQKKSMIEVEVKLQNNALYQQNSDIGDHSSAEWAEETLRKQLNNK